VKLLFSLKRYKTETRKYVRKRGARPAMAEKGEQAENNLPPDDLDQLFEQLEQPERPIDFLQHLLEQIQEMQKFLNGDAAGS
jgi:hypothetical protein